MDSQLFALLHGVFSLLNALRFPSRPSAVQINNFLVVFPYVNPLFELASSLTCKDVSSSHPDLNYLKLDWSASIDLESSSMFMALIYQEIVPDIILGADIVCTIPFSYEISIQLLNQAFDPSVTPVLVGTLKIALQTYTNAPSWCEVALIVLMVRNKDTVPLNNF